MAHCLHLDSSSPKAWEVMQWLSSSQPSSNVLELPEWEDPSSQVERRRGVQSCASVVLQELQRHCSHSPSVCYLHPCKWHVVEKSSAAFFHIDGCIATALQHSQWPVPWTMTGERRGVCGPLKCLYNNYHLYTNTRILMIFWMQLKEITISNPLLSILFVINLILSSNFTNQLCIFLADIILF